MKDGRCSFSSSWRRRPAGRFCRLRTERQWLAGDSHIHSHWSADYDETKTPPEPITGVDGRYATPINAYRARRYGLALDGDDGSWRPEPLEAQSDARVRGAEGLAGNRARGPSVLRHGAEHAGDGSPHAHHPPQRTGASMLYDIESRFDSQDAWPPRSVAQPGSAAQRALEHMKSLPLLPLMFANHPSRSARASAVYGSTSRASSATTTTSRRRCTTEWKARPAIRPARLRRMARRRRTQRANPPVRGAYGNDGRTHLRRFRSDDSDRRRPVGFDARRGPAILDRRDVRFSRALR